MQITTKQGQSIQIDDRVITNGHNDVLTPRFPLGTRVSFMAVCDENGRPFSVRSPTPEPTAVECYGYVQRIWCYPTYVVCTLTLDDGSPLGLFMDQDLLNDGS